MSRPVEAQSQRVLLRLSSGLWATPVPTSPHPIKKEQVFQPVFIVWQTAPNLLQTINFNLSYFKYFGENDSFVKIPCPRRLFQPESFSTYIT